MRTKFPILLPIVATRPFLHIPLLFASPVILFFRPPPRPFPSLTLCPRLPIPHALCTYIHPSSQHALTPPESRASLSATSLPTNSAPAPGSKSGSAKSTSTAPPTPTPTRRPATARARRRARHRRGAQRLEWAVSVILGAVLGARGSSPNELGRRTKTVPSHEPNDTQKPYSSSTLCVPLDQTERDNCWMRMSDIIRLTSASMPSILFPAFSFVPSAS
ncbi:hypothetical protein C8J57DRAFT_1492592 [Mycena rebaudengoi]|nr:hypothetical protein C8J57DRAFT_1492592 [Mycena rebaudengoi]